MAKNGGDNISKYRHVIAKPMIARAFYASISEN
jgi:hypothetical protein